MNFLFKFAIKYRYFVLPLIFGTTLFSLLNIGQLEIDPGYDRLIGKSNLKKIYDETVHTFGEENSIVLMFEDPNIFSPEKLTILQKMVWKLEELEGTDYINSIFHTPHIISRNDILHTGPLFEEVPETKALILERIAEVKNDPLLNNVLIRPESNSILINIKLLRDEVNYAEYYNVIEELIKEDKKEFQTFLHLGNTTFNHFLLENIKKTILIILPIVILVISLTIFWGSKSIHAASLPVIVSFFSVIWTCYLMILLKIPIHFLNACIPGISFVLGSTEITHIFSKYSYFRRKGHCAEESIYLMGEVTGSAVIITAMTTVFGFLAICLNEITMLKEFGIVSSIALSTNFIIMAFYLPIHLFLFDKNATHTKIKKNSVFGIKLYYFQKLLESFLGSTKLYFCLALMILVSIYYTFQISIDNSNLGQIKDSSTFKKDIYTFDSKYSGLGTISLVITPKNGNYKQVENYTQLSILTSSLKKVKKVRHTQSITTPINLLHKELNNYSDNEINQHLFSNPLLSQYFLTFTRSDLYPYISADYKKANIYISHSEYSTKDLNILFANITKEVEKNLDKSLFDYYLISSDAVFAESGKSLISSQVSSLCFIAFFIIIAIALLFRDLKIALIAVPSNLIPVIFFFGILGLTGITLNIGTSMVAAITIGIAVDDTIHFFVQYSNNMRKFHNPYRATIETLQQSTRPIVTTSISLALGFIVFLTSDLIPLSNFGLMSAIVILIAMVSDLVITPAIIATYKLVDIVPYGDFIFSQLQVNKITRNKLFLNLSFKEIKNFLIHGEIKYIPEGRERVISYKQPSKLLVLDGEIQIQRETRRDNNISRNSKTTLNPGQSIDLNSAHNYKLEVNKLSKYLILDDPYILSFKEIDSSLFEKLCDNMKKL